MTTDDERDKRIRARAYELWENDGRRDGDHERHWHEAAREIDAEGHSGLASDLQPGGVQPGSGPGRGAGSIGSEGAGRANTPARGAGSRRSTAKKR
ncbi:DUF2934 domain-containing protein [Sinorhizobium arboris]|uniref:DUF2934 domain-containing protein n=1 Tax=Sinorhizobium arboris TaxID=76745 RepID=UPI000482EAAB|nr:DUF2934 domain-containing protein [Sinorhizobium arboris]